MKSTLLLVALTMTVSVYSQTPTIAPANLTQNTTSVQSTQIQPITFQQNNGLSINPNTGTIQSTQILPGHHTCGTYDLTQQHYQDRGLLNEFNQSAIKGAQAVSSQAIAKTPGINTISVIFHVVHNPNNPAENVSNTQIMQVYNDLVEDYQLLNSNASNARTGAPFNFLPADANINFCLATQDEFGTPLGELGIIRVSTNEDWYNSSSGEENKMKSSVTGGSQIWDRNEYLNIWICDISNGANSGTAGYAFRPTPTLLPSSDIDGIVLDYNLGVNNENVLTHEVGHYLGLDHTWGGSGGCTNDDGFGDTPQTAGPSFDYPGSCSGSQTTCSTIETQYENYMDYGNCSVMFTQNQADYMLTILQGIRSSLLISSGCNIISAPPNSAFYSIPVGPAPVTLFTNGAVNLMDQSTNVPTSWAWTISGTPITDWEFIGGTNASSQDPQIQFYNPGFYNVSLTATNGFGSDLTPAIENSYIQVITPAAGIACDTLRNWDPTQSFTYYDVPQTNGAWGYIPGHAHIDLYGNGSSVENALQYAEQFSFTGTAEVRRVKLPIFIVEDLTPTNGAIEMKVYDDDNGANPGTVLASETVLFSDLVSGTWNEINFTTPATVSGTFFVGMELQYGTAQDTIQLGLTSTPPGAPNSFFMDMDTYGWMNSGLISVDESIVMDVMLSNGPAPITTFVATDDSICVGGTITANGSGSINTTDYFWYLTDTPFTTTLSTSNAPTEDFSPASAGAYTIWLFGEGSCMTDGVLMDVIVSDPVTATVTPTTTTCGLNDGSISVTGMAGGSGTYYYSLDGINYQTSPTFNSLPSGTYDVWVSTQGDACQTLYTVTIGASSGFNAGISSNSTICPGESTTITASGGTSYEWFDGVIPLGTTPSIAVTPSATSQYSCVVMNAASCQSTMFTTVTILNPPSDPVITASGPLSICPGTSVDLTSSYSTNNTWSTIETNSIITVSTAGSFTVTHTDTSGCSSTSATVIIDLIPEPTISAGTVLGPTACGSSTGSIQISGTGNGDLTWTGTTSGNASSTNLPHTVTGLSAGSYNFTFVDNATGCTSNLLSQGINDPNPPATPTISTNGATTFCFGDSVELTSSYGTGNSWTTTETSAVITVSTSTTISVTYTDVTGCSATSAPIVITVNSIPTVPTITSSTSTTFCDGESVDLTSSQVTGNNWSTTESTQTISASTDGNYTVTYTDGNGCSSTSNPTTVTVNPLPTVTQSPLGLVCDYDAAFTLTGASPAGGVYSGTGVTGTTFDPSIAGIGTHAITYDFVDGNGCSNSAIENIEVDACLSIDEFINEQINVYPNPTLTELNIELDGDFTISMFDSRGRIVFEGSGSDLLSISTADYEAGVYLIQISNDQINTTTRVVKN